MTHHGRAHEDKGSFVVAEAVFTELGCFDCRDVNLDMSGTLLRKLLRQFASEDESKSTFKKDTCPVT